MVQVNGKKLLSQVKVLVLEYFVTSKKYLCWSTLLLQKVTKCY